MFNARNGACWYAFVKGTFRFHKNDCLIKLSRLQFLLAFSFFCQWRTTKIERAQKKNKKAFAFPFFSFTTHERIFNFPPWTVVPSSFSPFISSLDGLEIRQRLGNGKNAFREVDSKNRISQRSTRALKLLMTRVQPFVQLPRGKRPCRNYSEFSRDIYGRQASARRSQSVRYVSRNVSWARGSNCFFYHCKCWILRWTRRIAILCTMSGIHTVLAINYFYCIESGVGNSWDTTGILKKK